MDFYKVLLSTGANDIKLFTAAIYEARVFVYCKPCQVSLVFAGKAGAYPSEKLSVAPHQSRLLALPTKKRLAWKSLPGATICNLQL
jgi:hypothetical protein